MEVLATAASGMAVASLSIQLLQTIGTIRTFIRDVKSASRELERLAALLDRLNALLENVQDVMERQTSLQGQHFPAPAQMIFDALKSCKGGLEALQSVVERYKGSHAGNKSSVVKWKDDIKFGFKTKDIAGFEVRIQQEIDYLHAALSLNSTSILTTVLPVLLQNQQASMTLWSRPEPRPISTQSSSAERQTITSYGGAHRLKSQHWESRWLQPLGIRYRGSMQYLRHEHNEALGPRYEEDDIVHESQEVLLTWSVLKVGIHWTKRYPKSQISWSLSTFPIVAFFGKTWELLRTASIIEIQRTFASGCLHPFTRDKDGHSLLHIAAYFNRADIVRLLFQYGLRPTYDHFNVSPLLDSFIPNSLVFYNSSHDHRVSQLETVRLLFQDCEIVDDFESQYTSMKTDIAGYRISSETLEWVWFNGAEVLSHQELQGLRSRLFESLLSRLGLNSEPNEKTMECIVRLISPKWIQRYLEDNNKLLRSLFRYDGISIESHSTGSALTGLCERLGLDLGVCINLERERFLETELWWNLPRRVILERSNSGVWILRWVWVHDPCASGYLLASEYIALGADFTGSFESRWPFPDSKPPTDYQSYILREKHKQLRLSRRMANKARKERARTGQKTAKSKMPGGWNW